MLRTSELVRQKRVTIYPTEISSNQFGRDQLLPNGISKAAFEELELMRPKDLAETTGAIVTAIGADEACYNQSVNCGKPVEFHFAICDLFEIPRADRNLVSGS